MADVFLSYSSKDREIARRVADRLKAEGYDVWWDTQITSGDAFQQQIERQLHEATAVLVIWTDNSVESRWVMSEASLALDQGKLVPVRVGQPQLPLRFNVLQTADLDNESSWLPAIHRLVQGPGSGSLAGRQAQRPRAPGARASLRNLRGARLATVYWLGIGGAVLTLIGNLESFAKLADWIKFVFRHWSEIITLVWRTLIPWRVHVSPEDAVILTLLAILFFNLLITSRNKDVDVRLKPRDFLVLISGVLAVAYLGFVGFADKYDDSQTGLVSTAMLPLRTYLEGFGGVQIELASFGAMIVAGILIMTVAYTPFALAMGLRPNVNAYGVRLWRILAGVAIAFVINQISVAFESRDWQQLFELSPAGARAAIPNAT